MGVQGLMRHLTRIIAGVALLAGCTEADPISIGTQAEGDVCRQIADCMAGLGCEDGVCVALPVPDTAGRAGDPCTGSGDCMADLCCGNQSVCRAPFGGGACGAAAGEQCGLSPDCDVGLVCDGSGVCAVPDPNAEGQAGLGQECGEIKDCVRPLICSAQNTCESPPFFAGVSCVRSEEDLAAFRAYFEVPRGGAPLDEFYRQPFPSDVRLVDGRPVLAGHPSPGDISGIDFDQLYLRALEEDRNGWGLTQPVFIRFSDPLDASTVTATATPPGVELVALDDGSRVPIQTLYNRDAGQFICHSALAVAPIDGVALDPLRTYAVIVKSSVRNIRGEAPIHDADFRAMLEDATPSDPDVAAAHEAYEPLRAYIGSGAMAAEDIAVAAVFTTGDPSSVGFAVQAAIETAPAPVVSNAVRCLAATMSPCAEDGLRNCPGAPNPAFEEIHARVSNPVLQRGTRPYLNPQNDPFDGAFEIDVQGNIVVQGSEDVCVGIAVPTSPMPANGYPVVIYGHGTGGDFTSGLLQVAESLAGRGIAVITFDGSQHGPRQGLPPAARLDAGRAFFNAANPRAARDNVLQGGGDVHNLVKLARNVDLASIGVVGLTGRFDPERVMYYGHSQGTVVGAPFVAAEPNLHAAVFTGAGAEIGLTLVNKRRPNDIAALTRSLFGDQTVSRMHPMIGLMSMFFGPSDATPYAANIAIDPPAARGAVDFLHVYGLEDGFTPEVTQAALIRAGMYPIVGTALAPVEGVATVPSAVGNIGGASVGSLQYTPSMTMGQLDYDGHFVGTRNPQAVNAILRFLSTAAMGGPGRIEP